MDQRKPVFWHILQSAPLTLLKITKIKTSYPEGTTIIDPCEKSTQKLNRNQLFCLSLEIFLIH